MPVMKVVSDDAPVLSRAAKLDTATQAPVCSPPPTVAPVDAAVCSTPRLLVGGTRVGGARCGREGGEDEKKGFHSKSLSSQLFVFHADDAWREVLLSLLPALVCCAAVSLGR